MVFAQFSLFEVRSLGQFSKCDWPGMNHALLSIRYKCDRELILDFGHNDFRS